MSLSPCPAKLIGFDPETLRALELLSADSGKSLQQLADEAFVDLLAKHHRPHTFLDALKQSARPVPANENKPKSGEALDGAAKF